MFNTARLVSRVGVSAIRWNSTAATSLPPMMVTLRSDLKQAMREKDQPRLNVVKALISETNGSAKTASPIQTDVQLLGLITKKLAAAKDASAQFLAAGRPDLKEKEDAQVKVWEHYASQVETMGPEEIKSAVSSVITQLQSEGGNVNPGTVLKSLLGPGGALDRKPVAKADVAQTVKDLLAQPKA